MLAITETERDLEGEIEEKEELKKAGAAVRFDSL